MPPINDIYATLGFVLCSGSFSPHRKQDGTINKNFVHDSASWKDATQRRCLEGRNGYALLTGETSGCTAIDIDDPTLLHNRQLMSMLDDAGCNMVAKTRKGFHYIFAYDPRIRTVSNDTLKLDTRNNAGLLYVAPSRYVCDDEAVEYIWLKTPTDKLTPLPEIIVTYLESLWPNYIVVSKHSSKVPAAKISHIDNSDEGKNDDRLRGLLLQLPQERWNNYTDWITIGMAMFNEGCSLTLWDNLSQVSPKFVEGECAKKWATFRRDSDRKITARTLMGWVCREEVDDVYACRCFIECMGDEIHREDNTVIVFDPVTGMWLEGDSAIIAAVQRHKNSLVFYITNEDGRKSKLNYGGNTKLIRNMLYHLRSLLPNERFIDGAAEAAKEYLLFTDGIFHIPTRTFTEGFDKRLFFTANIPRKFPRLRNKELEAEINTRLFVSPLQTVAVGQYLKFRLARAMAGCYRDKRFLCAIGEADSSKGTITRAMRAAFGGYVVEWDANHMKYNSHSGADEAKRLSWVFPIMNARLAISNECRMDKVPIDGNLLKTLSSGGDVITARQNFKDERAIVLRASFLYMGNDMPEITPKDSGIQTRVRVVRFTKRFVEHPTLPHELPADPTIKEKLGRDDWADAVFWLIMDAYGDHCVEPVEVIEETREWVPQETSRLREILEENYTIDPANVAEDNWVAAREIINYVREQQLNLSDTKIGKELAKIGLIKTKKKIDGRTLHIWKGIH